MRDLRYQLSPWEGKDRYLPQPPSDWDVEEVDDDAFGDVHALTYRDDESLVYVTVDFRPWLHGDKREINFTGRYLGTEVEGTIPLAGYEKGIPKLLSDLQAEAKKEEEKAIRKLDDISVSSFWRNLGYEAGDLSFVHEEGDETMSVSFLMPIEVFTGEFDSDTADISYSKGADYEGRYGVKEASRKYEKPADIQRILKAAEKLWGQWGG